MYTFTLTDAMLTGITVLLLAIILLILFMMTSISSEKKRNKKLDQEVSKKNQELTDFLNLFNERGVEVEKLKSLIRSLQFLPDISEVEVFGKKPYLILPKAAFDNLNSTLKKEILHKIVVANTSNTQGTFLNKNYFVSLRGTDGRIQEDVLFNPRKEKRTKLKKRP